MSTTPYSWAVKGAKVQYIGPSILRLYKDHVFFGDMPSPLSNDKVYTIRFVFIHPRNKKLAIMVNSVRGTFQAKLFRPLQKKDEETFNELLNDLPHDLKIEHAIDAIWDKVLEDG